MFKCGMCDNESKTLAGLMAHQRAKHADGNGGSIELPAPAVQTAATSGIGTEALIMPNPSAAPAVRRSRLDNILFKLGLTDTPQHEEIARLRSLLEESEDELASYKSIEKSRFKMPFKDTARLVALGAAVAGLLAGGVIAMAVVPEIGVPFLPLVILMGFILLIMRKDIPFNLKFLALKLAKKNPRVIYNIDNCKTITRVVEGYNPQLNTVNIGRGKRAPVIDWVADSQLIDGALMVASGIHVGGEKVLRDIFKEAGDLWAAKTVDMMIKDAEQLGELKSTEKLDKLVQIGYIVALAAVIGTVVSVLTLTSVGELVERIDVIIPMLQNIPALVANSLGR